jgi:hypothetical protein
VSVRERFEDCPNLPGQVPSYLYPSGTGFPFHRPYNSHGYGGGIRTHLHAVSPNWVTARVTLRRAVYRQLVLGDKPLETHDLYFSLQLNTCGYSPYVTSCLTRGWVSCLQLLLTLASAVILRSESRGTHDHILTVSDPRVTEPGGAGPRIYTPRHWVPFPSPPTTRRRRYPNPPPHWVS